MAEWAECKQTTNKQTQRTGQREKCVNALVSVLSTLGLWSMDSASGIIRLHNCSSCL